MLRIGFGFWAFAALLCAQSEVPQQPAAPLAQQSAQVQQLQVVRIDPATQPGPLVIRLCDPAACSGAAPVLVIDGGKAEIRLPDSYKKPQPDKTTASPDKPAEK